MIDADSLNDFGYIECSFDGGEWYNFTDSLYQFNEFYKETIFTGTSQEMTRVTELNAANFLGIWALEEHSFDSITYRFVFVSDSIETNQDGWLIDDIRLEKVFDISSTLSPIELPFDIYPNPANDFIQIHQKEQVQELNLSLFSRSGELLLKQSLNSQKSKIDITNFSSGIYFYQIKNPITNNLFTGKMIKH